MECQFLTIFIHGSDYWTLRRELTDSEVERLVERLMSFEREAENIYRYNLPNTLLNRGPASIIVNQSRER